MGKTIVDAAAEAGVRHFVFSSGPNSLELTGGKVKMNAAQGKSTYDSDLSLILIYFFDSEIRHRAVCARYRPL
jgi:hypothetical protein